jgi:hypothetical protein
MGVRARQIDDLPVVVDEYANMLLAAFEKRDKPHGSSLPFAISSFVKFL